MPFEKSKLLRLAVGQAILKHAATLYWDHSTDPQWECWYRDFLKGCRPIGNAVLEEVAVIQNFIQIPCVIDGNDVDLTPRRLCEHFGDSVPIVTYSKHKKTDGIYEHKNSFVLDLPGSKLADGTEIIDLTPLRSRLDGS